LGKKDLYFLVRFLLSSREIQFEVDKGHKFWEHPWIFNRCREVQLRPNGCLDLWARGHGKSTIITFGLSIQDILNNPEITIGIFSNTRPLAKGFLRHIKNEFEGNEDLKKLYPDILWQDPKKEASKWSEDEGIVVKRKGNPKEATVEAWGVLEGHAVGRHFDLRIYDDVIEESTVTTPEMVEKTTRQWELSTNLGKPGGIERYIGTRYAFHDLYNTMLDREVVRPRIRPALNPPSFSNGTPVFFTREFLEQKYKEQGPFTFAAQQLLNPVAEDVTGLKSSWLKVYEKDPHDIRPGLNVYITVDPANAKKKHSDYTAIMVVGLGADENCYLLDIVRDRIGPKERIDALIMMHMIWKPYEVRYEKYGMQSDLDYLQHVMDQENYRFPIQEVGGLVQKNDRIRRLIPPMKSGKLYVPQALYRKDYQGQERELIKDLRFEMDSFPVGRYDDMLDSLSRLFEPSIPLRYPNVAQTFFAPRRDRWLREPANKTYERSWLSA